MKKFQDENTNQGRLLHLNQLVHFEYRRKMVRTKR